MKRVHVLVDMKCSCPLSLYYATDELVSAPPSYTTTTPSATTWEASNFAKYTAARVPLDAVGIATRLCLEGGKKWWEGKERKEARSDTTCTFPSNPNLCLIFTRCKRRTKLFFTYTTLHGGAPMMALFGPTICHAALKNSPQSRDILSIRGQGSLRNHYM